MILEDDRWKIPVDASSFQIQNKGQSVEGLSIPGGSLASEGLFVPMCLNCCDI